MIVYFGCSGILVLPVLQDDTGKVCVCSDESTRESYLWEHSHMCGANRHLNSLRVGEPNTHIHTLPKMRDCSGKLLRWINTQEYL